MVAREAISGIHAGAKFPTILKIVLLKDTMYFIRFMNNFLSQRIEELTKPRSNYQYKIIPDNVKSTASQPMPSPNCTPTPPSSSDEIEAGKEQDQKMEDSDGDQFMQDCVQQQHSNHDNNNNNNNNITECPLPSTQTKHFLNKKYVKPNNIKYIKGAISRCKQAKVQAQNKKKPRARTQIPFSTKHNFCLMVEGGMSKLDAWRWCKDNGFDVGKCSSGCGRWARKGSNYYLRMIAKHGDAYKFCTLFYIYFKTHIVRDT